MIGIAIEHLAIARSDAASLHLTYGVRYQRGQLKEISKLKIMKNVQNICSASDSIKNKKLRIQLSLVVSKKGCL